MKQKIEYYVIKNTPITESLKKIESSKDVFNKSDKVFEEWQLNFKKAVELGDIRCDKSIYEAMFAKGFKTESLKEAHYNQETGEVEPDWFYGVDGVEYIWHGEYADPEVWYKGELFNYYDLEDWLYSDFIETTGSKDSDEFAKWVKNNPNNVYSALASLSPIDAEDEFEVPWGGKEKREVPWGSKNESLKEGYYGETLYDFFECCIEPSAIDKVQLWKDDIVYEGSYDDIPEELLDAEFIEFDTNDKLVINVDSTEGYGYGTYEFLNDFLEDCNSDIIEVFDLGTEETIYSGYKDECPDEILEMAFESFDSPSQIACNIEYEDDDLDESKKPAGLERYSKTVEIKPEDKVKVRKSVKEDKEKKASETLWTNVCSNRINAVKKYFENGGKTNLRYNRFDKDNSLIMGALRNGNIEMVELLKSYGETILPSEKQEYKLEVKRQGLKEKEEPTSMKARLDAYVKSTEDKKESTKKSPLEESVNLSIDEDDLKELLCDRVDFWVGQSLNDKEAELFYQMYEDYVDGGVFEGYKDFNVAFIVDNDVVNYCKIIKKGDDFFDEVARAYEEGESLEVGDYYIEQVNDDGTMFLVRYI